MKDISSPDGLEISDSPGCQIVHHERFAAYDGLGRSQKRESSIKKSSGDCIQPFRNKTQSEQLRLRQAVCDFIQRFCGKM